MIDTIVETNNAPVPITPAVLLKYLLPNNPSITKVTMAPVEQEVYKRSSTSLIF
jgi:hypothetical protein